MLKPEPGNPQLGLASALEAPTPSPGGQPTIAAPFSDRLRSELNVAEAELERLRGRHRLVEELLNLGSDSPAPSAIGQLRAQPSARRSAPASAKRSRLPRGLISGKFR